MCRDLCGLTALKQLVIDRYPRNAALGVLPTFTITTFPPRLEVLELRRTAVTVEVLSALAGACGVPRWTGAHPPTRHPPGGLPTLLLAGVSVGRLVFSHVEATDPPGDPIFELLDGPFTQAMRGLRVSEMVVDGCVWAAPTSVTSLELKSMSSEPLAVARIVNACPGLRRLSVQDSYLNPPFLADELLLRVESLTEVHVACPLNCLTLEPLGNLTSLRIAKRRDFSGIQYLAQGLARLHIDFANQALDGDEALPRFTALTSLHLAHLHHAPFTLPQLTQLTQLKRLELPRFKVYGHSPVLQLVPLEAGITRLSLAYPALDTLPRDLGPLTAMTALHDLDVSGWDLSAADALLPLSALQPLSRLVASGCRLLQPPPPTVAPNLPNLRSLDVSCNPGFDPGFFFGNLPRPCALTFLDFSFCRLACPPPRLQCVPSLRELVLTGNTHITAPMLADLRRPGLTVVL